MHTSHQDSSIVLPKTMEVRQEKSPPKLPLVLPKLDENAPSGNPTQASTLVLPKQDESAPREEASMVKGANKKIFILVTH